MEYIEKQIKEELKKQLAEALKGSIELRVEVDDSLVEEFAYFAITSAGGMKISVKEGSDVHVFDLTKPKKETYSHKVEIRTTAKYLMTIYGR